MPTSTRRSGTADTTSYYYVKGERVPLEREPKVYAVRLRGGVRDDSPTLSPPARRTLRDESEPIGFIANYGLRVMRLSRPPSGSPNAVPESVSRLDSEGAVDQATTAYRRAPGSEELMFTTRRFVVQFKPDVDRARIDELNKRYGVALLDQVGYMPNGFTLQAPAGEGDSGPVALANAYFESGLAISATPDFVRRVHFKRAATTASRGVTAEREHAPVVARDGEYLGNQWHLTTARVTDAWQVTIGEPSIVVAILDDGIDVDHTEFAGKVKGQSDFEAHVSDARPKSSTDNHGTACAGVAVALGAKAHGSAPGCSLLAVRTPVNLGVADEAEMFRWACDEGADVISCSWGPADGTGAIDPLPDNVRAAIHYCVQNGRQGKGIPIVWAAGNGNESVSLDGYAANPDVMAIAASTDKETRAWYSDYGPEVWVCAPSSGSAARGEKRIFTTDRHGGAGYNGGTAAAGDAAGDYTNDFGGTSAATPLVAGIIGLMLSVRPELTHQQVRDILRSTAVRIGDPTTYNSSGHSPQYGFGRVDARRAVDAAAQGQTGTPATPTPAGGPTITAPVRLDRSAAPPTFTIGTGANALYAVEVATTWQMFDGGTQTEDTFYASWATGPLLSDPTFPLPEDVWHRLRSADRLYYRVHTARDTNWTGHQVSTPDSKAADAPSIELTGVASTGATEPTPPASTGRPTITGPRQVSRADAPPRFTVDPSPNPLYAVELATRWQLFEAATPDSERTQDAYYATWNDSQLLSDRSFQLPDDAWQRLHMAERLYYRVHTATDSDWSGHDVSTPDSEAADAPFVRITTGQTRSARTEGIAVGDRPVRYPSVTVVEAGAPDDRVDYSDPVTGGAVPLIEVRDRLDERLSPDFAVRDLAAPDLGVRAGYAAFARISPDLVAGLQAMRDRLGAAITVSSCYRYPALNEAVGGTAHSRHLTGQAADIRSGAATPLELARVALEVLGPAIGLGLGSSVLHVDVRGEPATWVYEGAAMSAAEFESWVRGATAAQATPSRQDSWTRSRPSITGPAAATTADAPPSFTITPGGFAYHAVEVTTQWELFASAVLPLRTETVSSYASWRHEGMRPSGDGQTTTYTLPAEIWRSLAPAGRLYYRVLGTQTPEMAEGVAVSSTPPEEAEEAPSFPVSRDTARRAPQERLLDPAITRRLDEAHWRSDHPTA